MSRFQKHGRLLVVLLVALLVLAPVALAASYFTDVSDATTASGVETATNDLFDRAITNGCNPPSNTRFCPFGNVARWEMALFLDRVLDLPLAKTKGAYAAFDGGRSTTGDPRTPAPSDGLYVVGGAGKRGLVVDAGAGGGTAIVGTGSPTSTGGLTRTGVVGTGEDYGVVGVSANGIGVKGSTDSVTGVFGFATGGTGVSGHGVNGHGVYGQTELSRTAGVFGDNVGAGPDPFASAAAAVGVWGHSLNGRGVYGLSDNHESAGVVGENSKGGHGVEGYSHGTLAAVSGSNDGTGIGVLGVSQNTTGVYGAGRFGVTAIGENAGGVGIFANAIFGATDAGQLQGNVVITGNLKVTGSVSKGSGSFTIDHPLDPTHKYLSHSFVESPDMMNIYNGNVVTDEKGEATVQLPAYFEALNRDFRYQLTAIGQFAQAIVADKIHGNRFTIKTDKPQVEVSWQVTGMRHDAYANASPIVVEQDKPAEEQGTYLHPTAFGQTPPTRRPDWLNNPEVAGLLQRRQASPEVVAGVAP